MNIRSWREFFFSFLFVSLSLMRCGQCRLQGNARPLLLKSSISIVRRVLEVDSRRALSESGESNYSSESDEVIWSVTLTIFLLAICGSLLFLRWDVINSRHRSEIEARKGKASRSVSSFFSDAIPYEVQLPTKDSVVPHRPLMGGVTGGNSPVDLEGEVNGRSIKRVSWRAILWGRLTAEHPFISLFGAPRVDESFHPRSVSWIRLCGSFLSVGLIVTAWLTIASMEEDSCLKLLNENSCISQERHVSWRNLFPSGVANSACNWEETKCEWKSIPLTNAYVVLALLIVTIILSSPIRAILNCICEELDCQIALFGNIRQMDRDLTWNRLIYRLFYMLLPSEKQVYVMPKKTYLKLFPSIRKNHSKIYATGDGDDDCNTVSNRSWVENVHDWELRVEAHQLQLEVAIAAEEKRIAEEKLVAETAEAAEAEQVPAKEMSLHDQIHAPIEKSSKKKNKSKFGLLGFSEKPSQSTFSSSILKQSSLSRTKINIPPSSMSGTLRSPTGHIGSYGVDGQPLFSDIENGPITHTKDIHAFRRDELVDEISLRSQFFHAARLHVMLREIDYVLPGAEAELLYVHQENERLVTGRDSSLRLLSLDLDPLAEIGPTVAHTRFGCKRHADMAHVISQLENIRLSAAKMKDRLEHIDEIPSHRDIWLLRQAFADLLPPTQAAIARQIMQSNRYARMYPRLSVSILEGRDTTDSQDEIDFEWRSWTMWFGLVSWFTAVITATLMMAATVPSVTGSMWLLVTFLSFLGEMVVATPVRIWFYWVAVGGTVRSEIYWLWYALRQRTLWILNRHHGVMHDCHALVQHWLPACRVARTLPLLPISRLLIALNDFDVPQWHRRLGTDQRVEIMRPSLLSTQWIRTIWDALLLRLLRLPESIERCVFEIVFLCLLGAIGYFGKVLLTAHVGLLIAVILFALVVMLIFDGTLQRIIGRTLDTRFANPRKNAYDVAMAQRAKSNTAMEAIQTPKTQKMESLLATTVRPATASYDVQSRGMNDWQLEFLRKQIGAQDLHRAKQADISSPVEAAMDSTIGEVEDEQSYLESQSLAKTHNDLFEEEEKPIHIPLLPLTIQQPSVVESTTSSNSHTFSCEKKKPSRGVLASPAFRIRGQKAARRRQANFDLEDSVDGSIYRLQEGGKLDEDSFVESADVSVQQDQDLPKLLPNDVPESTNVLSTKVHQHTPSTNRTDKSPENHFRPLSSDPLPIKSVSTPHQPHIIDNYLPSTTQKELGLIPSNVVGHFDFVFTNLQPSGTIEIKPEETMLVNQDNLKNTESAYPISRESAKFDRLRNHNSIRISKSGSAQRPVASNGVQPGRPKPLESMFPSWH